MLVAGDTETQRGAGGERTEGSDEGDDDLGPCVERLDETVGEFAGDAEELLGVDPPRAALGTALAGAVGGVDGGATGGELSQLHPGGAGQLLDRGQQIQAVSGWDAAILGLAHDGDGDVRFVRCDIRLFAGGDDELPLGLVGEGVVGGEVGADDDGGVDGGARERSAGRPMPASRRRRPARAAAAWAGRSSR